MVLFIYLLFFLLLAILILFSSLFYSFIFSPHYSVPFSCVFALSAPRWCFFHCHLLTLLSYLQYSSFSCFRFLHVSLFYSLHLLLSSSPVWNIYQTINPNTHPLSPISWRFPESFAASWLADSSEPQVSDSSPTASSWFLISPENKCVFVCLCN